MAGSGIVAHGWVSDAAAWEQIVGLIMTVLPALWGIWDKFESERKTKDREMQAMTVGALSGAAPVSIDDTQVKLKGAMV